MTRAIAVLLLLLVVSADLEGTRRMDRDNRRCASIGRQVERHGITEREYARLARHHCKRSGDTYVSDRFYQA